MDSVTELSIEFAWKLNSKRRNLLATTAVVPFVMLIRTILIPNLDCFDGERNVVIWEGLINLVPRAIMSFSCRTQPNLVLKAISVPARDEPHHTKYLLAVKPFAERQQMPWGRGWTQPLVMTLVLTYTFVGNLFQAFVTYAGLDLPGSRRLGLVLLHCFCWLETDRGVTPRLRKMNYLKRFSLLTFKVKD